MAQPKYTDDEVCRRGEELYTKHIKAIFEKKHRGKYLAIDVETGEYEIGDELLEPADKILARRPDAVLFGMRIGFATATTFGHHQAQSHRVL